MVSESMYICKDFETSWKWVHEQAKKGNVEIANFCDKLQTLQIPKFQKFWLNFSQI